MNMPAANSNDTRDTFLFGRRAAWFAYAMTVALMIFDYVDRQVIVSMFPWSAAIKLNPKRWAERRIERRQALGISWPSAMRSCSKQR